MNLSDDVITLVYVIGSLGVIALVGTILIALFLTGGRKKNDEP